MPYLFPSLSLQQEVAHAARRQRQRLWIMSSTHEASIRPGSATYSGRGIFMGRKQLMIGLHDHYTTVVRCVLCAFVCVCAGVDGGGDPGPAGYVGHASALPPHHRLLRTYALPKHRQCTASTQYIHIYIYIYIY